MRTLKLTFAAVAATTVLAFSGCITINGTDNTQPQPSTTTVVVTPEATASATAEATHEAPATAPATTVQAQAPQPAAPEGVAPGTSCGPSNTGASTLVIAENAANLNCEQVQSIFADFNATFTSGDTSNYQIQGFTCHTRSPEDVSEEGRSVTCTQGGTRLEAMTVYPLGGIPVAHTSAYKSDKERFVFYTFTTDFAECGIGGFEGYGIFCTGVSNGQPVQISVGESFMSAMNPNSPTVDTSAQVLSQLPSSYSGKYLPAGEVFTTNNGACLNAGDSLTCSYRGRSFTLSPTGYTLN